MTRVAVLIGAPPPLRGHAFPLDGPGIPGRLVFPGAGTYLWAATAKDGREIYVYQTGSRDDVDEDDHA